MNTHQHTHSHTHTDTHTHIHISTLTHACTVMNTHPHTHSHTHIHTQPSNTECLLCDKIAPLASYSYATAPHTAHTHAYLLTNTLTSTWHPATLQKVTRVHTHTCSSPTSPCTKTNTCTEIQAPSPAWPHTHLGHSSLPRLT